MVSIARCIDIFVSFGLVQPDENYISKNTELNINDKTKVLVYYHNMI